MVNSSRKGFRNNTQFIGTRFPSVASVREVHCGAEFLYVEYNGAVLMSTSSAASSSCDNRESRGNGETTFAVALALLTELIQIFGSIANSATALQADFTL
jgi:hypothetical protein